jgi:hypothetical protein
MNRSFNALLIIAAVLGTACDPIQTIIIKPTPHSTFSMYGRKELNGSRLDTASPKTVIHVPKLNDGDKVEDMQRIMVYRIGVWNDRSLQYLASLVDSIVVVGESNWVLRDSAKIELYLKEHVKGAFDSIIELEAR